MTGLCRLARWLAGARLTTSSVVNVAENLVITASGHDIIIVSSVFLVVYLLNNTTYKTAVDMYRTSRTSRY